MRARAYLFQESNGSGTRSTSAPIIVGQRSLHVTKKSVARIRFGSFSRSSTRLMRATSRPGTDSFGAEQYGVSWRRINRLLEEGFTKAELVRRVGYKRPAIQFKSDRIVASSAARVERF